MGRGARSVTCYDRNRSTKLRKFFKHTRVQQLSKLKIADVERFFVLLGKQGWTLLFTSAFP